ncbi:MAG TPA: hypothetical protein VN915_08580 [Elusimicrobiota bacterium]|nr:hypothetical protein [Elusimicrobiota bacterium]
MKRACTRLLAAAAAVALSVQSTGAASLPLALTVPRAAFPPPASRFAAFPAAHPAAAAPAKAPAGSSWLASARVVCDFVIAQVRAGLDPSTAPPPDLPAPGPDAPIPSTMSADSASPEPAPLVMPLGSGAPADRMLIAMEPGRSVAAVLDGSERDFSTPPAAHAGPAPALAPFRGPRLDSGGLVARASFLRPRGLIRMDSRGFTASFADGTVRRADGPVPATALREFPIYFHDEEVEIRLTVENKTGRTLRGVRLEAVQETFRPVGTEGTRLAPAAEIKVADALAPGGRATARWTVRLAGPGHAAVNLEQTHVRVTTDGAAAPLLDAPQAGVIDPPGPGWR